jgi:hypothetical protein
MEPHIMNADPFREVRHHIDETGHRDTKAVICECGRKYRGNTSGGYYHHRISHHGDKPVPKEGLEVTVEVGDQDKEQTVAQHVVEATVYQVEEQSDCDYGEQAIVGHVEMYDELGDQNGDGTGPTLYNLSGIVCKFSSSVLSFYNHSFVHSMRRSVTLLQMHSFYTLLLLLTTDSANY